MCVKACGCSPVRQSGAVGAGEASDIAAGKLDAVVVAMTAGGVLLETEDVARRLVDKQIVVHE